MARSDSLQCPGMAPLSAWCGIKNNLTTDSMVRSDVDNEILYPWQDYFEPFPVMERPTNKSQRVLQAGGASWHFIFISDVN